jgi:hypothetical protein
MVLLIINEYYCYYYPHFIIIIASPITIVRCLFLSNDGCCRAVQFNDSINCSSFDRELLNWQH